MCSDEAHGPTRSRRERAKIKNENGQIKTVKEEQPHELKIFETDLGAARGLAAELANERPTGTRRYAGLRAARGGEAGLAKIRTERQRLISAQAAPAETKTRKAEGELWRPVEVESGVDLDPCGLSGPQCWPCRAASQRGFGI